LEALREPDTAGAAATSLLGWLTQQQEEHA